MKIMKAVISFTVILTVLLIGSAICKAEAEDEDEDEDDPRTTTVCGISVTRLATYQEHIMPYVPMIHTTLQNFNVDKQFIWLAMMESGGSVVAVSKRGAVGLWQLTAPTSRHNGCPSDQRTDPKCSTMAAARYLSKLLTKFNNNIWDAIVGYNMGGSNYKRIGKPTSEARHLANTVTCLMQEMPLETWVKTDGEP